MGIFFYKPLISSIYLHGEMEKIIPELLDIFS